MVHEWEVGGHAITQYISGEELTYQKALYSTYMKNIISTAAADFAGAAHLHIFFEVGVVCNFLCALTGYFAEPVTMESHEQINIHFSPLAHVDC